MAVLYFRFKCTIPGYENLVEFPSFVQIYLSLFLTSTLQVPFKDRTVEFRAKK